MSDMSDDPIIESDDPIVEFVDVHKSFGTLEVLNEVNLTVNRGAVVCIMGPSGAGKSTLLRCVNQLESIDDGEIWLDGELLGYAHVGNKLVELPEREVRRQRLGTGMVFQRFNLFTHMTALENVVEGPLQTELLSRAEAQAQGRRLLDRVGLDDKHHAYPAQLSGGQQQRVAIARALAMRPSLLLFDEPTSALDPELVGEVLDVMTELAHEGMTMLVVTHEVEFAREAADEIVFMADGTIVETGPPDEVFTRPTQARTKDFLARVL